MIRWGEKATAVLGTAVVKGRLIVETIPAAIVTQVNALGHALHALTCEHRDSDLTTLEAAPLQAVHDALPHFLWLDPVQWTPDPLGVRSLATNRRSRTDGQADPRTRRSGVSSAGR